MNLTISRMNTAFLRVDVFFNAHPELSKGGTLEAGLVDDIKAALNQLSEGGFTHALGSRDAEAASALRAKSREAVRGWMATISRTAAALQLDDFWMPSETRDFALIRYGKAFASKAEPFRDRFVASHLPPDFIEQLLSAIAALEDITRQQAQGQAVRRRVSAELEAVCNKAMESLRRLDALMENLLRDNSGLLAEWKGARRVPRPARKAETVPEATT